MTSLGGFSLDPVLPVVFLGVALIGFACFTGHCFANRSGDSGLGLFFVFFVFFRDARAI